METITIASSAVHGPGFSELALLALAVIVVGLVAWQIVARTRSTRTRGG